VTGALPRGVVTGLGAIDVIDPPAAARVAFDEAPDFPHVPEAPLRGPWAEPFGRLAAVLVDLPVELDAGRWRMASSAGGPDLRRARSMLAQDLDAVEEQWSGFAGAAKLQLLGPLSASTLVELRSGAAAVSDAGALHDLAASLTEGLTAHLGELSRRVPAATWVVQLDEPGAAAVTRGEVSRPSGWGWLPALASADASALLASVVAAARRAGASVVVHCCDPYPDWELLSHSDAEALSIPLGVVSSAPGEWLDQWWGEGADLWPAVATPGDLAGSLAELGRLGSVLGADAEALRGRLVLTPTCAWAPGPRSGGHGELPAPVGARAYAEVRAVARHLGDA